MNDYMNLLIAVLLYREETILIPTFLLNVGDYPE